MEDNLSHLADNLMKKTKEYLLATLGRSFHDAQEKEIYRALAHSIREEIMINLVATERTFNKNDVRRLYYLSMEFLPGRFFSNNVNNISHMDLVKLCLKKMGKDFRTLIANENEPGLGNGGLGRLASCLLDSLATLHYPAQGYGLRYQYGIFEQHIHGGVQVEAPDCWLINDNPWELKKELDLIRVKYGGHATSSTTFHGDTVQVLHNYDEVWAMPYDIPIVGFSLNNNYSVIPLRLWSTKESPRNFQLQKYNAGQLDQAAENILITDVLYPNELNQTGKRLRLKQEYLLCSASIQDIIRNYLKTHDTFNDFANKIRIQINDTHPAFLIAELIRILTKQHDIPWKKAIEITREVTSYTNHTILSEALEQWDQDLIRMLLPRQYKVIELLNSEFCEQVRSVFPHNEDVVRKLSVLEHGKVRMANLSIIGSHKVNGVANIHTEILKNIVFKDFYEMWPDRFVNVTNGVTQRRWLLHCNPALSEFISKRIGNEWTTDFKNIEKLIPYADDPESEKEFWAIRKQNKDRLINYVKQYGVIKNGAGKVVGSNPIPTSDSLFDVQIKRFHEYKRQLMNVLNVIMTFYDILDNPEGNTRLKRTVFFAGKAAAGYETAKIIIRLIYALARKINKHPLVAKKLNVIFLENYNVSLAEMIVPAADISEQISMAGTEASGTSVMKFAMNGALTVGTHDGANVEINNEITDEWYPFRFGASAEEIANMKFNNSYNAHSLYLNNHKIKRAVDSLKDRVFAQNEEEHQAFSKLYHYLVESHYSGRADDYYVLYDLQSYYDTQLKVEKLYMNPSLWYKYAIHNIGKMGKFSSDETIRNYSNKIWDLTPCPTDPEILSAVRNEYHDQLVKS